MVSSYPNPKKFFKQEVDIGKPMEEIEIEIMEIPNLQITLIHKKLNLAHHTVHSFHLFDSHPDSKTLRSCYLRLA